MKNSDYIVQEREPEFSRDVLHRKLFNVNLRLYATSERYKAFIQQILAYMRWVLETKWEDYSSAKDGFTHGISGANLGIPLNIIGFRHKGKLKMMLNPEIIGRSKGTSIGNSNCGSIKYLQKIPVQRNDWIMLTYFDPDTGELVEEKMLRKDGGFTVQHEVDHNNGILISDRYLQQGGDKELLEKL